MKYLGTILVAYIVLFILDIMQKRNHKTTKSLNKFSIRTISDVSFICAIGALFVLVVFIWGFWSEPENFCSKRYLMFIIPFSIIIVISTVIVMAVTGKVTQLLIHKTGKKENK